MEALADQKVPPGSFEVVVVDDGSSDDTAEFLESRQGALSGSGRPVVPRSNGSHVPALVVVRQTNAGPTIARNVGAARARGSILAFTDSDCLPAPNWISTLLTAADAHPDAVGFEGRTLTERDRVTPFTHQVENLDGGLYCTCNMAYRTEAFRQAGGFDEDFFYGHEDTELAVRVGKLGPIRFVPEMVVVHPAIGQTFRRRLNQVKITVDNEVILFAKTRDSYHAGHGCGPIWTVLFRYGLLGPVFALREHREFFRKHPHQLPGYLAMLLVLRLWLVVLIPRLLYGVAQAERWSAPRTPFA